MSRSASASASARARPKSGAAPKQRSAAQREKAASDEASSGKRRKAASPSAQALERQPRRQGPPPRTVPRIVVPAATERARNARAPRRRANRDRRRASDVSRTLILVKPDAFERGLTGEVITRFERKGLRPVAMRLMQADEELANRHYAEHAEKPFFGELVVVHHPRPARRDRPRGQRRGRRGAPADRRHQPARGGAGIDPRRLRDRGHVQPRPRLGLRRVGRARGLALVSRTCSPGVGVSRAGARSSTALGVDFEVVVPEVEELGEGEPREVVLENARRKARAVAAECPRRARDRGRHRGGGRGAVAGQGGGRSRGAVAPARPCRAGRTRCWAGWCCWTPTAASGPAWSSSTRHVQAARRRHARPLHRLGRVARPRRRLRDPGPGLDPDRAPGGRLLERRRPARSVYCSSWPPSCRAR